MQYRLINRMTVEAILEKGRASLGQGKTEVSTMSSIVVNEVMSNYGTSTLMRLSRNGPNEPSQYEVRVDDTTSETPTFEKPWSLWADLCLSAHRLLTSVKLRRHPKVRSGSYCTSHCNTSELCLLDIVLRCL